MNSSAEPRAQGGNTTSPIGTPDCLIPKSKSFSFIRNSGRKKNSGISSLTSAVAVKQFFHVPLKVSF